MHGIRTKSRQAKPEHWKKKVCKERKSQGLKYITRKGKEKEDKWLKSNFRMRKMYQNKCGAMWKKASHETDFKAFWLMEHQ